MDEADIRSFARRDWAAIAPGAQAALIWGRPRLTADVDVTVRLEPDDPDALMRTLGERRFQLRVDPRDDFVRRTRVLPFVFRSFKAWILKYASMHKGKFRFHRACRWSRAVHRPKCRLADSNS